MWLDSYYYIKATQVTCLSKISVIDWISIRYFHHYDISLKIKIVKLEVSTKVVILT